MHPEPSCPALPEPDERAGGWDGRGRLGWDASSHTDGLTEVITHIVALLLEAMGIPGSSTGNKNWRLWGMTARLLSRLMELSVVSQVGGCSGKPFEWCVVCGVPVG